mgnify:CR=1 FL=1
MKKLMLMVTVVMVITLVFPFASAENVPDWIKNTAGWWATDAISETEFVNAVEFLINDGIIQVSASQSTEDAQGIPDWVKNTAGWWATDAISETEFVNAISFLINVGIINIESENKCVNDLLIYFDNKQKILDVCKEHDSSIHEELIPYDKKLKFNSEGFRGDEFLKEKSANSYRIFIVGGSTTLSSETSNVTTIPSILQKMLEIENPDKEIQVINAGISGGNTETAIELINSKIINYDPDLIIMYDGWNDLSTDFAVLRIINHYELICESSIKNDFNVIFTLQPIAGFGSKTLTNQEKINSLTGQDHSGYQLIQSRSTYDYLVREMMKLDNFVEKQFGGVCNVHDLRSIYDDVLGPVYWDQGHVLHAGNFVIAEKFFELSMKKINSSIIHDGKFTKIISDYNSIPILKFLLNEIKINDSIEGKFSEVLKISPAKGSYFQLKNEFGDASMSFVGKDLRDVDLSGTIIRGTNLSKTNFEGKDLSGMDLRGIDFSFANLKNTNLIDAKISKQIQFMNNGECNDPNDVVSDIVRTWKCVSEVIEQEEIRTKFHDADLSNAKFGMTDPEKKQDFYFTDFSNADLSNAKFESVTFAASDFTNAKINNVKGKMVSFLSSNLENVKMENFNSEILWIQNSSLTNSELKNGQIDIAFLIDLDITNTDLNGTEIKNKIEAGENIFQCKNHSICN